MIGEREEKRCSIAFSFFFSVFCSTALVVDVVKNAQYKALTQYWTPRVFSPFLPLLSEKVYKLGLITHLLPLTLRPDYSLSNVQYFVTHPAELKYSPWC